MEQIDFIENTYKDGAWFIGGRENAEIQDPNIERSPDGIYKPIALSSAEGIKLVENGAVTYEALPRSGEGDPFLVYLDYIDGAWLYITAANMSGTGEVGG
ncbi:hypothetical protein GCM10011374_06300 [Kocuria dechangensis]|uniref:Uncharacterized protein n=2 Tax=Kocuria dechangensis TaxID=1176249 RepID=A0A917LND2_9MICC|nr:hypothetical protein GCM10011374_06300 [Kocuria dechangensis]